MRRALVIVMLLASALTASAQPTDRRGPAPAPVPRTGPTPTPAPIDARDANDRRDAIKKRIRVMRAATLTDELTLDEKTLARLLPVLSKWDDVTEDLLKKRGDLQRRLVAPDAGKDPKALDRLIDEAVANQKAFWELEDRRLVELRKILTPTQIARLLIVWPAFERKIHNQLRRAMATRRGGPAVEVDDDDDLAPDEPMPSRRR